MKKDRRSPGEVDVAGLVEALERHHVDYILIGGAAMMLHGYPRMTKDIDLLLPVNADNNDRLRRAFASVPAFAHGLKTLNFEWLDKGFSGELLGELCVDLLFVAAGRTYDEYKPYVERVDIGGCPVTTLDVDGMLLSKETNRESDVADRLKLGRLKNALYAERANERLAKLETLKDGTQLEQLFYRAAEREILNGIAAESPRWVEIEKQALSLAQERDAGAALEMAWIICDHSPGAVYRVRQRDVVRMAEQMEKDGSSGRDRFPRP